MGFSLRLLLLLALLTRASLFAEAPWGRDADLARVEDLSEPLLKNPLSLASLALIRFHQRVISPVDGPRSHYVPSSSYYARDAIRRYGFLKGFLMTCDRLMRENKDPWIYPTETFEERTLKVDPA